MKLSLYVIEVNVYCIVLFVPVGLRSATLAYDKLSPTTSA